MISVKLRDFAPIAIVLLLIGILVFGVVLRSNGSENWIQIVEVGTSTVLSLSLVAVYLRQNQILREHRQMMSAGYSPVVAVQDVSFRKRSAGDFSGSTEGQLHAVDITATNRGNDIAANLELRCVLEEVSKGAGRVSGWCSSNTTAPRSVSLHLETESDGIYRNNGPALPPTMEDPTTLYGHIGVNLDERYCSIPDAIDCVTEEGVSRVRLGFILQYDDASGDTYSVLLRALDIDGPQSEARLNELIENATEIYRDDLDGRIDEELQSDS